MSTAYYYFAASLPLLEFGVKPPLSVESFLEDCERLLSPEDFSDMTKAAFDEGVAEITGHGVLKEWKQFTHNFHNEIAWFRAQKTNKDPLDHIRGERSVEPSIALVLSEVTKSSDPLTGEKLLDKLLWQRLDELVQGHYFDMGFLIVYGAKLKILERYQKIESEKGKEIFEEYKAKAFY